ncbi:MAG: bacteriohemerythrin [Wenzhouxiangella sp.]|jgi:diguanylate cyclase (GGDEF)-like protein/hemerythrin-like metal-binding protein|nr:bacteriohemerythrin [Wenzhouxiangella sp.]
MNNTNNTHELNLLCQQSRSSSEPIAIIDEAGEVAFINAAMQALLPGGTLSARTRSALSSAEGRRLVTLDRGDGEHHATRQLFGITLGRYRLITLIEQDNDPRIERLKAQLDEAHQRSITDPLTGAWNRNQFDEFVRIEVPRAERYGQPICLLVVDIDHFKRVNDLHGHSVGDQILTQVCELMRQQIRLVDSLFRWGGEEFVILLPNTSLSAARFISERLRQTVGQYPFETAGPITVSVGAAELERGEGAQKWFERADQALYAAKHQGRNRVICAETHRERLISSQDGDGPVLLPWKSSYESGHPLIDQQHQELFRLGNRLITASLAESTGQEEFLRLADELIEHVAQHFSDEENILAEIGYAELDQHHKAHNGLLKRARRLRDQARSGTVTTRDVIDFLVNNLVKQHMLTADMAFFSQLTTPADLRR